MASSSKKAPAMDMDIHVAFEDQQKINLFARKNARLNELKENIAAKEKEMQNLEDASDELMIADDTECLPYQIGEVFILMNNENAQDSLEKAKTALQTELDDLKSDVEAVKQILSDLKVKLYANFGDNINLEEDSVHSV